MKSYYVGEYAEDAKDYRGWIVGSFIDSGPRKVEEVEVKYWTFDTGPNDHPLKKSSIVECTLVLSGKTEAMVDGEKLILSTGSYIVIPPGIENNLLVNVLEPISGITIKAPSDITAKQVLEK